MKYILSFFSLLILLIANSALAQTSRSECNFDTILEQSYFFQDSFYSQKLYSSDTDTGWRMGYALKANPSVSVYIGHTFSPDTSTLNQLEYLNHIDFELSRIQQIYANQGIQGQRIIDIDANPTSWGVLSSPNYGGISYNEEYIHYQVGNTCNLILLKRVPLDFSNNELLPIIDSDLDSIVELASAYMGPVVYAMESSAPTGFVALVFGVVLPVILGFSLLILFNKLQFFPNSIFSFQSKLIILIPQMLSYIYLVGDFVVDYIDNNKHEGFELSIFYVLALISIMSWGVMGKKLYIPLAINSVSFILSLSYLIMGWSYNVMPFVTVSVAAVFMSILLLFLSYFIEEDFRIKRDRRVKGLN